MKLPHTLSDQGLSQYADEHLQYELDMLMWSTGILAFLAEQKNTGYLPWAINNGLLNSYAFHVRNLVNFLYSRSIGKDYPTDIILEDYVDAEIISNHLPEISPLLEEALTKANKQAAHLSMERIQYELAGKEWQFVELSKQILGAFASIAPHIPSSKMSEKMRNELIESGFKIPVVDIEIGKSPSGYPISVNFAISVSDDGNDPHSVSA